MSRLIDDLDNPGPRLIGPRLPPKEPQPHGELRLGGLLLNLTLRAFGLALVAVILGILAVTLAF